MLPPPRPHPLIDGPMATIALRPTLDRWAPPAIARLVLPMQRIIAVASLADGDQAVFAEKLGLTRRPSRRILAGLADRALRRRHFEQVSRRWESLFFGDAPVDPKALVTAELARRDAAVALLSGGREFLEILRRGGLPVEALPPSPGPGPGPTLGAIDQPAATRVVQSRPVPGTLGVESWVRFPAPTMGDQAWARVYEPADGKIKATMIFLHGIAMETEFWPDRPDPINALTQAGFRVLRPIIWEQWCTLSISTRSPSSVPRNFVADMASKVRNGPLAEATCLTRASCALSVNLISFIRGVCFTIRGTCLSL